jgi:hypothetical protein
LPTALDINAKLPVDAPRAVVGLRQKLNLLDSNLILAWAGNRLQAMSLARSIRDAVRAGATNQGIIALIDETPLPDRNDVSFLGTIATPLEQQGSYDLGHFLYNARQRHRGEITVSAAGSGAEDLFECLPHALSLLDEHERVESQVTKLGAAISGFFVGQEATTGLNLLNWWGGALELAYFDEGRFLKVDGVLHTLWRARKMSEDDFSIELRPAFIKYDYFGDALVVQSFEFELDSKSPQRARMLQHTYRPYAPLLKGLQEYDWDAAPHLTCSIEFFAGMCS